MSVKKVLVPLIVGGIIGSNILTMSLMNFFETPTRLLVPIYLLCAAAVITLMIFRPTAFPTLAWRDHVACVICGIALFAPRIPYLLEGTLGYAVNLIGDDFQHIQMLSSIVHTPIFPPRSTFDRDQFLCYYYAPWMLGAVIYWAGTVSTVKEALGLSVLVYCTIFSYSILYAARILFKENRLEAIFIVLCVFYGGFNFVYWLSGLTIVPTHVDWWPADFGIVVQYSSFFTLVLWVQQHMFAALSILYALYIAKNSRSLIVCVITGTFLASAFFSSPFVSIGALPLLLWHFSHFRNLKSLLAIIPVFLLLSIPLCWIFFGKSAAVGFKVFGPLLPFWKTQERAAFVVFLTVLSLQLMPLLCGSFKSILREYQAARLCLFSLTALFLISTFFLEFSIGANYSMRGSILPIFTLIYLATPEISTYVSKVIAFFPRVLACTYLLGGILEYSAFCRDSIVGLSKSRTDFNRAVLKFNEGKVDRISADIVGSAPVLDDVWFAGGWYLIERNWPPKEHIDEGDLLSMGRDNRYRITAASVGWKLFK